MLNSLALLVMSSSLGVSKSNAMLPFISPSMALNETSVAESKWSSSWMFPTKWWAVNLLKIKVSIFVLKHQNLFLAGTFVLFVRNFCVPLVFTSVWAEYGLGENSPTHPSTIIQHNTVVILKKLLIINNKNNNTMYDTYYTRKHLHLSSLPVIRLFITKKN